MFIKKDLRKIPRILEDAPECPSPSSTIDTTNDAGDKQQQHRDKRLKSESSLSELRLGRRHQEFQGSLQILCQPKYVPKLQHLKSLNLYDCGITNVDHIGFLAECPALELLNLGRNPLEDLAPDLAKVQSLKHIWLDDCQLAGPIPAPLLELAQLETLRMPNNQITDITGISKLTQLKLLCLDRNELHVEPGTDMQQETQRQLPEELGRLSNLEELYVRHCQLTALPSEECFAGLRSLRLLHLSSNPGLTDIEAVKGCTALTHLYANGNQLTTISELFMEALQSTLKRIVVSHNPITDVPESFWKLTLDENGCEVMWQPNPNLTPPPSTDVDVEMAPASTE